MRPIGALLAPTDPNRAGVLQGSLVHLELTCKAMEAYDVKIICIFSGIVVFSSGFAVISLISGRISGI